MRAAEGEAGTMLTEGLNKGLGKAKGEPARRGRADAQLEQF